MKFVTLNAHESRNGGGGLTTPLVSVIVPIYNIAPYVQRGLESLLAQDYRNLQLILVDDHSDDDSAAVIATYAKQDARIEPVYLPRNCGVSAARNAGLAVARGLYVAFMDGDDWLAPDYVSRFVTTLEQGPYDILVSPFYVDDPKANPVPSRLCKDQVLTRKQFIRGMLAPVGVIRGYLWNKFYRRSIIESAHLRFDERVAIMEDELFNVEYALAASRFYYLGAPAYHHVIRADSATQSIGVIGALPKQITALWSIQRLIRTRYQSGAVPEEPLRSER